MPGDTTEKETENERTANREKKNDLREQNIEWARKLIVTPVLKLVFVPIFSFSFRCAR